MTSVHPSAIVNKGAELGEGVQVGPYCVVGQHAVVGSGTVLLSHVVLDGWTTIGKDCMVFPFASIGTQTQDLKYTGGKSCVNIGNKTTLREYVTVNSATAEGELTKVGSNCHIMAYCHVAHNCSIGDNVIMSNCTQLAGHVMVEDHANVGGMTGVHQFVRIGRMSFVGGFSRISQDVPPFLLVEGNPAVVRGINSVGLQRREVDPEVRRVLKEAFRILYRKELSNQQALAEIRAQLTMCPELEHFVAFVESSERGIMKQEK